MNRLLTKANLNIFIFVIIVLLVITIIINFNFSSERNYYTENWLLRTLVSDAMHDVNDSIPAYKYKQIEDSIKNEISFENYDLMYGGTGWNNFSFGTKTHNHIAGGEEFYLSFQGYQLDPDCYFFNKGGKTFLKCHAEMQQGYQTKEVKIKFVHENSTNNGTVLIPTSKNAFKILNFLNIALITLSLAIIYYMMLITPLKVLLNIAKGIVFDEENLGSLFTIAYLLIFFGILPGFISIISYYLYVQPQLPDEVSFSIYKSLLNGRAFLIAGLCFLLIAKAFLRGYQLQEEQNLTI